jgi:hypothetical protein
MPYEIALFRSVHSALTFAYNCKHGQLKPNILATMIGNGGHGGGLQGLDGCAQAGMILSEVSQLRPVIHSSIISARYSVHALPCTCKKPCCSGWRTNIEWEIAIAEIAEQARLAALGGTVANYTLRHTIVRRYFGLRSNLNEAAERSGVDRNTASAHAGKIITFLKDHEKHSMYEIEGRLKAGGVIE